MSVWKGNNLIASTIPGKNGLNGADGRNGQGVMIVNNYTELHNNIGTDGTIVMTNRVVPASGESQGHASWCEVGGFNNKIVGTGQATMVWGYGNTVSNGQSGAVFGYGNKVDDIGQGGTVEGYENDVEGLGLGSHIEGNQNLIHVGKRGIHVEGYGHNFSPTSGGGLNLSDGGHLGGYGLTSIDRNFIKTNIIGGAENTYIEAIGVKVNENGELGRLTRNDGCVGIKGDLTFTAVGDQNRVLGRYTLGEIVQALITAGILPNPNASNT